MKDACNRAIPLKYTLNLFDFVWQPNIVLVSQKNNVAVYVFKSVVEVSNYPLTRTVDYLDYICFSLICMQPLSGAIL